MTDHYSEATEASCVQAVDIHVDHDLCNFHLIQIVKQEYYHTLRDSRLPTPCRWDCRSAVMLCGVIVTAGCRRFGTAYWSQYRDTQDSEYHNHVSVDVLWGDVWIDIWIFALELRVWRMMNYYKDEIVEECKLYFDDTWVVMWQCCEFCEWGSCPCNMMHYRFDFVMSPYIACVWAQHTCNKYCSRWCGIDK